MEVRANMGNNPSACHSLEENWDVEISYQVFYSLLVAASVLVEDRICLLVSNICLCSMS